MEAGGLATGGLLIQVHPPEPWVGLAGGVGLAGAEGVGLVGAEGGVEDGGVVVEDGGEVAEDGGVVAEDGGVVVAVAGGAPAVPAEVVGLAPADARASLYDVLGAELELELEFAVGAATLTVGLTLTDCWMLIVGLRIRKAFMA